ncbi:ORF1034 [White spot syndrome virus]|uniref:ORF1034 n=1 Tax=White spot syndrome virus TaxID=342409 RepID=A0A2D3I6N2_9VIRU|nr:ORF1034 [White spot syndrome virus]
MSQFLIVLGHFSFFEEALLAPLPLFRLDEELVSSSSSLSLLLLPSSSKIFFVFGSLKCLAFVMSTKC